MVVGFTDMFTPTIIAAEAISSNMTKFIVATVSVTQLIYLSEVGGLILASKLPTDMFTPTIIAAEAISSNMTKFIVATVSVTQLIYLSEVGGLILASKLPVKFWELFLIFIERTVISLLIVAPIAHLIF